VARELRGTDESAVRYTVKQVAELAGISVRTLHHYDRIGLLKPSASTDAGYRIYERPEIERLQQILFFRELGFELRKIGEILDHPEFDRRRALLAHRELLNEERDRLGRLIGTLDTTIERLERDEMMSDNAMFSGFDRDRIEDQISRYHDEAVERYGEEVVAESEHRVRSLSDEALSRAEKENIEINMNLAAIAGAHPPDSPEAQREIERWFNFLNENFGAYTPEAFAGLGELYVADERFTAHYEAIQPGLARFIRDSMRIFAERRSG
jgi:MerR family transcriptional regulator, multidrug-efflux activator